MTSVIYKLTLLVPLSMAKRMAIFKTVLLNENLVILLNVIS